MPAHNDLSPLLLENYTKLASEAAQAAAYELQKHFAEDPGIQSADGRDIKTAADCAAEAVILQRLRTTKLPILSEECGGSLDFALGRGSNEQCDDATHPLHWIVDPLDGTMNFSRKMPLCCVSIALWRGTQPLLGVIHDLARDQRYLGNVAQSRATICDVPIHVSSVNVPQQAVLATGLPTGANFQPQALLEFSQRIAQYKKVRMIGSAALSLAWVARGSMDLYYEQGIRIWDVAAGMALVQAAGGTVACSEIDANGRVSLLAGVPELVAQARAGWGK